MLEYQDLPDFLFNKEVSITDFNKYLKPLHAEAGIAITKHVRTINMAYKAIDSYIVQIPKFLSSQFLTHQVLKSNGASSRAIPTFDMINHIPFYRPPVYFKNCKGMAGKHLIDKESYKKVYSLWLQAETNAQEIASLQANLGVHKQHIRGCETYKMTTYLVTGTEWLNLFRQRAHMAAQPEFISLALMMQESIPEVIYDEIHLPFGRNCVLGIEDACDAISTKANIALAAKISYRESSGCISSEDAERMYNMLLSEGHLSPFNHVATSYDEWSTGHHNGWSVGYNGWQSERVRLLGDAATNAS
jgi:thymidylate synthase ThyX